MAASASNDKIVKLAGQDIKNVQDYTKVLGTMKADDVEAGRVERVPLVVLFGCF